MPLVQCRVSTEAIACLTLNEYTLLPSGVPIKNGTGGPR
jgi:hypothetical protein